MLQPSSSTSFSIEVFFSGFPLTFTNSLKSVFGQWSSASGTPSPSASGGGGGSNSKSYVVEIPATLILKQSAFPIKLSHAPAPNPATIRTPPRPLALLTIVASGSTSRMSASDLTPVPGVAPAVPFRDHQPPFKASHVCQVSSASAGCGFDGKKTSV